MDVNTARPVLEKALALASERGVLAAECVWGSSCSRSFSVCDDELEKSRTSFSACMGLRVWDSEHRQGVASLNDFDGDPASLLCDMALLNAKNGAVEDDVVFADDQPTEPAIDLGIYDPRLISWEPREQIELCMEMSRQARALDKRIQKVRSANVDTVWGESLTLNTNGVSVSWRATMGELSVSLIAAEGNAIEIGGAGNCEHSFTALTSVLPVNESVEHTVRMLHGRALPTGRYTLVFEPEMTAALLSSIADLFSASNVCKGLTLLADKMGESVASEALSLVDDGRLYGAPGTAACDSECVATQRTTVLDKGKVSSWLCNLQYGKRLGLRSTGNGCRGMSSLPDVDVNNFFVLPGINSWEDLVADNNGCFCVTELMGLHAIDSVTGDFSLAARGLHYQNGLFSPVSSVTIAGNLTELLKNVVDVGDDLRFYDRFGGCSMVVKDVAVAGL